MCNVHTNRIQEVPESNYNRDLVVWHVNSLVPLSSKKPVPLQTQGIKAINHPYIKLQSCTQIKAASPVNLGRHQLAVVLKGIPRLVLP